MSKLQGVCIVLATPFLEDGSIDFEGFGKNLDKYCDCKVHALMVAGALGEYLTMTFDERKKLVEFAAKRINKRVPMLVGTIAHRTEDVIMLTNHAKDQGAAGVMILPPPGTGLMDDEIYGFYKAVAENVSIPIMVYNNPGSSGMDIEFDLLKKIVDLPNIAAIKESSGDIKRITRIRQELRDDFVVFCGWEDMHLESFQAGAEGWICMGANFAPGLTRDILDNFNNGDLAKARELSNSYTPIARHMETAGKVSQITKYIMDKAGFTGGYVRAPRKALDNEQTSAVDAVLQNVKLY